MNSVLFHELQHKFNTRVDRDLLTNSVSFLGVIQSNFVLFLIHVAHYFLGSSKKSRFLPLFASLIIPCIPQSTIPIGTSCFRNAGDDKISPAFLKNIRYSIAE